jgi:hypothetical protein
MGRSTSFWLATLILGLTAQLRAATPLEPEQVVPVYRWADNRAVRLTVENVSLTSHYGELTAPESGRFLVVSTEWTNHISLKQVKAPVPTYMVGNLADEVYLVIDGRKVAGLAPEADGQPGVVAYKLFRVAIRQPTSGNLVFVIPGSTDPASLDLRFYDSAFGDLVVPLKSPEPAVAEAPKSPPLRNEVVEAGVFAVESAATIDGSAPPPGMTWLKADLRMRSLVTFEADAQGFDPTASRGQKLKVVTVADWTESRKYVQMVVDGEYGYTPEPSSDLAEEPRFLPDIFTGGSLVFLVPAQHSSLELRCGFPNAKRPDGTVLHPADVVIPLSGKTPALAALKPLVKIEDDIFVVSITGQSVAGEFAGHAAEAGRRMLVLDVTVENRGQKGEFFQTAEQMKYTDAAGQQSAMDQASSAGPYPPAPLLWIPANERRSFQAVYQIAEAEVAPRLAYSGVSKAEMVALPKLTVSADPSVLSEPTAAAEPAAEPEMAAAAAEPVAEPAPAEVAPAAAAAPAAEPVPQTITVKGQKFPARVPVRPDLKPRGLAGVGLTAERVNAAIDKGCDALWDHIRITDIEQPRGKLGDHRQHLVACLALVHGGLHKRNADFDAQLRRFIAGFEVGREIDTYELGLYCMLIESYGDPSFLPHLKRAARWLVETQGPDGTWGYGKNITDERVTGPAAKKDLRVLQVSGGRPLDGSDRNEPMTRFTAWDTGVDGDNSVTQYALLGLHAASRSGLPMEPEVWRRAMDETAKRQVPEDGGWAYHQRSTSYGSMTCAGVCAMAIASHELKQDDPAIEQSIERGLAWLNASFSVTEHPGMGQEWKYYYLYSLERVGRILDTEFIGEHEWYPLGAQNLVNSQSVEGLWEGEGHEKDPRIAGSFALLFLTRATASLADVPKSGPGILKTNVTLPPGRKLYIIMDASGSMLEEMGGRPKFEIAREAMITLVKELPANAQVALRAYGYRLRAIEPGASEDSKLLVPMKPLGDKVEIMEILNGLRARGKTPLAYSLEQALGEVRGGTEDMPVTVLLLTDGGEDTQPRRDPVAAAAAYAKLEHTRFRIVGFDINREDWSRQLVAMAEAGQGQYLPAGEAETLVRELRTAVFETPDQFEVADQTGKTIARGPFGQSIELPAGQYTIRATYAGRGFEEPFWINAATTTAITFVGANAPTSPAPVVPAAAAPAAPAAAAAMPAAAPPAPVPEPAAPAAPAAKKFCTQCGNALTPGSKFCTKCGAAVKAP